MSYSNYQLNQKIENLQFQVNNLVPPSGGFVPINLDTTINDVKTFTSLPRSIQIPTLNDQLVNKLYVDTVSGTPALSAVLTAGNNAGGLSITNLSNLDVGNINVGNINGSAYPPVVPADTLANVLTAGNTADNSIILQDGLSTNLMEKTGITLLNNDGITGATNLNLLTSNISGNINIGYTDIGGNTSQTFIKSQANQTETSVNVIDNTALTSGTRTDITIGGAILDTQTATDLNNNIFSQHSQQLTAGVSGQAVDTLVWDGTLAGVVSSFSTVVSPALLSNELKYDNTSSQIQNTVKMDINPATSSVAVGAVNTLGSTSQFIRLETPQSGNARIEHQVVGSTKRSLALTTAGNLLITADNIDLNSSGRLIVPSLTSSNILDYNNGSLKIINGTTGGLGNVLLLLQNNSNTAGASTLETYKNDLPTSTGGDVVGIWTATCNTNVGKTEIARISQIAYGVGASNNDGGIVLSCKVNSSLAPTNFLACNGGVGAGEVQIFRPITNPTGNIELNATSSSGVGDILLTPKTNGNVRVSENIRTSKKITTEISGSMVGSFVDFAGGPDQYFRQDQNNLVYHFNDLTNLAYTTLKNDIVTTEQSLKQEFSTPTTTTTTTLRNDITNHSLTMDNTTTTEGSSLTIQRLLIGDNANNKTISINNSNGLGASENRIDLFKNSGGGIYNSSGFSNDTTTQQVFLNSTDNAVGKNVSVYNNTSSNAGITYDNSQDNNPFIITSNNTQLTLQTNGTTSGSGNIEFSPSQNGSANGQLVFTGASLQSNSAGGNSGEHLIIVLNGTTYKIKLENP